MWKKYLSSLRSTYYFMIMFGLVMGAVFPFYSYLFFGSEAFSPLYALGCLTAGFLVGTFCYQIIKQVMRLHLESQWKTLSRIVENSDPTQQVGGDELHALFERYDQLIASVLVMVQNISALTMDIVPLYQELSLASQELEAGNITQVAQVRRVQEASQGMQRSFERILTEAELLTARSQERASIAAQMSAATDGMAASINEYYSAVMETTHSITEMAASIRLTSNNVNALHSSTEQSSSSIFQISAAVGEIRDRAIRSSDCSENVRVEALEGMRSMEATHKAMMEIESANLESSRCIERLASKSARVGEVLTVIQEVVQQTNLLALNALIIAAQAGEQGKSFTVVADEVKSLARRTALSATEIDELLKDMKEETARVQRSVQEGTLRVKQGVTIAAVAAKTLARIEDSAAEASEMVRQIAVATEEQASATGLITAEAEKNLERVKRITLAIREQEAGAAVIVKSLEQMKNLAGRITQSSQEQARGNRLYLASVVDDSEKANVLKGEFVEQYKSAEEVSGFLRETGSLIESNACGAQHIAARIEGISELTRRLQVELAPLMVKNGTSAADAKPYA